MTGDDRLDKLASGIIGFCEAFKAWEDAVAKMGRLSPPQLRTVCVIGRNSQIRMKDIADRMELTTGTVTVMIDRLHDLGLVERIKNDSDRRSYVIALSEKGRKYYEDHSKKQRDLVRKLVINLTESDRTALLRILDQFMGVL